MPASSGQNHSREVTEEDYDWFLDTILKGKFPGSSQSMKKRGGGVIVHTGSMWALQAIGATPSSAYSAANAGVNSLVHNLALELPPTISGLMLSCLLSSRLPSTQRF